MKSLPTILFLIFGFAVAYSQTTSGAPDKVVTASTQNAEAELRLTTSIIDRRCTVENGSKFLSLTLNLTYTNTGIRPILLDKKSSLIYRTIVSRNLEAASAEKYEYDESTSFISVQSMRDAGMHIEGTPEKEAFITLKNGESYSLTEDVSLRLFDGTSDTEDFLHPGIYVLQVRVATWYYLVDPNLYREKWRAEGQLWSQNVTSEPMPLTVEKCR